MKKYSYIIIFLFAVVTCFSCRRKEKSGDVVILYTTDIHGNVLPYDFNKKSPNESSLANASTLIKELRSQYGEDLLLIDAGDYFQGTPSMYYYNYYSTEEDHLISRVSNYLEYDALVVGNHDLESGESVIQNIDKQLRMPWLGGNAIDTRINRAMFRPYKIFDRHGFKIAVLGLTTPESQTQIPRGLIPHIEFATMVDYAKRWVKEIQNNEHPDYIVCILHSGIKDIEVVRSKGDTIRDGLRYVVENVKGIDLVLFGHDHDVYQGEKINLWADTVKLLQPGAHGTEIGRIDIHLERKGRHVEKETKTERISLKDIPIDEEYVSVFKGVIDTVNNYLDSPLGYLDVDFDMVGTLYKQTNTMDFIHGIQLDATGADVSLASALSTFRDIPAGPITLRTIFSLYKYDNQLHKVWMTGEDIKKYLEYGYSRQFDYVNLENKKHLLAFKYDEKGQIIYARFGPELVVPQYNYSSAAGINYEVDVRKPRGNRVNIISMADGSPFDLGRQYTVAISSYQAAGGGGFINRGIGWSNDDIAYHTLSISNNTIIYLIADYIRETQHINPEPRGTWKVIPEDFANSAGPKDADLLIPYIVK